MNLPRHCMIYLLGIGLLSLFQIALGANVLVLLAIDYVCLFALIPMTRKVFGPNDILFLSFCFYYGVFSLLFKTIVLQPVQQNLKEPYLTSSYLIAGFSLIFVMYFATEHYLTKYYTGTRLRRWTIFEATFADGNFLARYTMPFSIGALGLLIVYSILSNGTLEVLVQNQTASSFNVLGSYTPLTQLALVMQLTLATRYKNQTAKVLVLISLGASVLSAILINHKMVMFQMAFTYTIFVMANRIFIRPRVIIGVVIVAAVTFLYAVPLIQITRTMRIDKTAIVGESIKILNEVNYNPVELSARQQKLGTEGQVDISTDVDYLAPLNLGTDRFTLLMPIDQVDRAGGREPIGTRPYLDMTIKELLPKVIVGEHDRENLADEIAWRYSIRNQGDVARPALGLLGTGLGTEGPIGLFVYAPLIALGLFVLNKFICNGGLRDNPFGIFLGTYMIFLGESDLTVISIILRGLLPMIFAAYGLIILSKNLK
jgi:hypothetical protein